MLKKNIYIHIEVLSRELPSQIFLSIFALKKNFRVHLGDLYSLKKLFILKKNKEGVFITKGNLDKETHKLIKKKCEKLVSLDQEITPGFSDKYYKNMIKSRYSYDFKNFDIFFCINKTIKKNFIKSLNLKKNKVIASGWPRFDLYKSKFRGLYSREVSQLRKKFGTYYLFNSDFGLLSNEDRNNQYKFLKKHTKNKKILNDVLPFFNITDFNNFKSFIKSLKFIHKLTKIVIRPHPAENLIEWKKVKKINPNITIEFPKYDVASMIIASKGVMHRGCTTGFQSLIFKKRTAYIGITNGFKKTSDFRPSLYRESEKINSINALKKWIDNSKKSNKKNNLIHNLLNIKKKFSSEIIIDQIEKLKISPNLKNNKFKLYNNFEVKFYSFKKLIYNLLAYVGIIKERDFFKKGSQRKIGKNFSKSNISTYINFFCKVLNLKRKISIIKLTDNLFEINFVK